MDVAGALLNIGNGLLHLLEAQAAGFLLGRWRKWSSGSSFVGTSTSRPCRSILTCSRAPGPGCQAEGILQRPGHGELAFGGERDGGHGVI
jgi:hypothetical protein